MQINLETIRRHADERLLRIERQPDASERLAALKKFLKIETQRLHLRHRFGLSGSQIVAARSLIVDLVVQQLAQAAVAEDEEGAGREGLFAIVALGGYGRRELAPHSDIDVLFLYGQRDAERAAAMNEAVLYLLWDVGFTVGHSCRSLNECLAIAKEDLTSRNALIDARLVWGSRELFAKLVERLDEEVFRTRRRAFLDELMAERSERYYKFGEVVCLQEPNVKEAAGGLRDLHSLLWAARLAYGHSTIDQLTTAGLMPELDAKKIATAYDFLLRVRNELHFLTARRTDQLTFDLQPQVARRLGYADTPELQASEVFMRDYYRQARQLHHLCTLHLQRAVAPPEKSRLFSRARQAAAAGGFVMRDGALEVGSIDEPFDAQRLMLAFSYSQATGAPFSSRLQELLQAGLPLINRQVRTSPEMAQSFLKLLRTRGRVASLLRQMHEVGFLGKYLPEFGRITCLVQHDLYHRYTIDEHTLRAIEALDELASSRNRRLERYRQLYNEVNDLAVLYLGLLLHDIGKGLGGGHVKKGTAMAERVCARLHLGSEAAEQVIFLVTHHLSMSHTSQRRDLADEKVIRDFAALVGRVDRLNMLTLLTYGDINGVGPGVWNEWKDALLWELYLKTRKVLAPELAEAEATEQLCEQLARMLGSEVGIDQVRQHFRLLPEDYARLTAPQMIIEHIRLANALRSHTVRTSWRVNTQARCTDLHLSALDRRGLFANIAGTLTAMGVNILSAHLNTRADGIVIDSFRVCDTVGEPIADPARWEQIDAELKRALNGELDVAAAVAKRLRTASPRLRHRAPSASVPTRITWDNQSSDKSTILEVRTGDRLGLAYKIASTLSALNLDITFAKVATEKNLALDIFYITDAAGEKLSDADLPSIEAVIHKALDGGKGAGN